jgi:PAS domain S-box-containing protein
MRAWFQHLSIKNKLILAIFSAATLVSVSASVIEMLIHAEDIRQDEVTRTEAQMRVLAQDFVKIVMFPDIYQTADVVAKLRAFPLVFNVYLYNRKGELAFRYEKTVSAIMKPPPASVNQVKFSDNFLQMSLPMEYAGSDYGSFFVRVSTQSLEEKLNEHYQAILAGIPVLLLVSYLLAIWLQRFFSEPIISLAQRLNRIADEGDFDVHIASSEPNELGSLYRSVNQLLKTIRQTQYRLQQGEARLNGIIDIAGSGIISIDEDHRIILFNREAEHIFGYSSHEVLGQPLSILLPPRFRQQHEAQINEFGADEANSRPIMERSDVYGLRKNGEEFLLEAAISQMMFEGNKIFTVAFNDISQRRQTEAELAAYRTHLEEIVDERTSELRAKNRELEAFSYSIAHDLRAPLRSITSFSQILQEDAREKLNQEESQHLARIIKAGNRMADLIDDILDLARIGRSQLMRVEVDLSAMVEKIAGNLHVQNPERQVRWEIQSQLKARGDSQLLRLMMDNLIGNAWKYSSKNEQAVISFGAIDQQGKRVYFVRDNGVGFDMQYAEQLFGVFQRLHSDEEFEGTGIGLATVQRIIQRHGGTIWAEAVEGEGATFFFILP